MAHHGNGDSALHDLQREKFKEALGATKKFPEGKLNKSDEGEIKFAVGSEKGKVILDFGTSVTWVGMTPAQAKQVGMALIKHADDALIIR